MYISSIENPRAFVRAVRYNRKEAEAANKLRRYKLYGDWREEVEDNAPIAKVNHYPTSELVYSVDRKGRHIDYRKHILPKYQPYQRNCNTFGGEKIVMLNLKTKRGISRITVFDKKK